MLKSLYAKNFALIDEVKVEFHAGLNIITGETGAGKSILIGALAAILGERLGKEVIRTGADKVVIEAEFALSEGSHLADLLQRNDIESFGRDLVIRREMNVNGRSRCFINDTPAQVSVLAELGDMLVDLHGQHQHQALLKASNHISYLDDFANLEDKISEYKSCYKKLLHSVKELADLKSRQQEMSQSRDVLAFQLNEITSVDPQLHEDDDLKKEEIILRNAELLNEKSHQLYDELYEKNGSASEIINLAVAALDDLKNIDEKFLQLRDVCENAKILIDDVARNVQDYMGNISYDSERLEAIRARLAELTILKKKHGGIIDAILDKKAELEQRLSLIENFDDEMDRLSEEVSQTRNRLKDLCLTLSAHRKKAGEIFSDYIEKELSELGMLKAKFKFCQDHKRATGEPFIEIDDQLVSVNERGSDQIEFLISANPGEEPKPLVAVASGGEISRIMLALKTLLADADKVPVLVFDEIDIGISGRIAQAVGRKLRKLAETHQVISITHLPQIASMATSHFLVEKFDDGRFTQTTIRELVAQERTEQIARLFGGESLTELHLQAASELIKEAESLVQTQE
jgi:DNA repair protein RecN (Recombination protein N)